MGLVGRNAFVVVDSRDGFSRRILATGYVWVTGEGSPYTSRAANYVIGARRKAVVILFLLAGALLTLWVLCYYVLRMSVELTYCVLVCIVVFLVVFVFGGVVIYLGIPLIFRTDDPFWVKGGTFLYEVFCVCLLIIMCKR